jgi:S-adenosylmethionine hydrolase
MPFWPEGTVFVSVCDPGVGTPRKASVAKTSNGYYIVTPDNGTLAPVMDSCGIDEIREIDQTINRYHGNEWSDKSNIFHGRDIFAYCGARVAAGVISFEEVGKAYPVSEIVR